MCVVQLQEYTVRDLKQGLDWRFLSAKDRVRELRKRGTRYAGVRGSSVFFRTFSSEYATNGIIYTQEIRLLDLKDALKMMDLLPSRRVLLAMAGDVAIRCTCLTGDVKIPLLDGRELSMEELHKEYGTEKRFWVYSVDEHGDFVPGRARCLGVTDRVKRLVKVTLDNDESFTCTPDHPVMMRDGSYRLAEKLVAGDSLMPVYRRADDEGYEDVLFNSTGKWERTYLRVAKHEHHDELVEAWEEAKKVDDWVVCHHEDFNKENNNPENLRWMGRLKHWRYHASLCGDRGARTSKRRAADPVLRAEMVESNRRAGKICMEKHPEVYEEGRRKGQQWAKDHPEVLSARMTRKWEDDYEEMVEAVRRANSTDESRHSKSRGCLASWADPVRRAERLRKCAETRARKRAEQEVALMNHKVVSVVFLELDEPVPVYDLEVEGTHNFLIGPGVVVHNCPAFLYFGFSYILTQLDASASRPEKRFPGVRNPQLRSTMCKHLALVMEVFGVHWNTVTRDLKKQGYF